MALMRAQRNLEEKAKAWAAGKIRRRVNATAQAEAVKGRLEAEKQKRELEIAGRDQQLAQLAKQIKAKDVELHADDESVMADSTFHDVVFTVGDAGGRIPARYLISLGLKLNSRAEVDEVRTGAFGGKMPAGKKGVLKGDVMVSLGGVPISSLLQFKKAAMKNFPPLDVRFRRRPEVVNANPEHEQQKRALRLDIERLQAEYSVQIKGSSLDSKVKATMQRQEAALVDAKRTWNREKSYSKPEKLAPYETVVTKVNQNEVAPQARSAQVIPQARAQARAQVQRDRFQPEEQTEDGIEGKLGTEAIGFDRRLDDELRTSFQGKLTTAQTQLIAAVGTLGREKEKFVFAFRSFITRQETKEAGERELQGLGEEIGHVEALQAEKRSEETGGKIGALLTLIAELKEGKQRIIGQRIICCKTVPLTPM